MSISAAREAVRLPDLERLEEEAARVSSQLDALLEHARDLYRGVQDAEAELGDDERSLGLLWSRRVRARTELAYVARQMTRAHASLIPRADRRHVVAQRVIGWCDEADDVDGIPRAVA